MKESWIERFDRIEEIILDADPIDLISGGAPDDEYDLLALEVFTFIKTRKTNVRLLSGEIIQLIERGFGGNQDIKRNKIQKIAEEILGAYTL